MSKTLTSWKTSRSVIQALHSGALAWIEGQAIPDVEALNLPDSTLGKLVHKAYVEQTSLGWNLLFRGFWSISWRTAQEYEFSHSTLQRERSDNGESWASRAQVWMFDLFDLAWGLRNDDEHGANPETQSAICLAKCERAIRRLYHAGESLPLHERHPFRDGMEDVLSKSLCRQERWVTMTEDFLIAAMRRLKMQKKTSQHSLKEYYEWSRTPRISP
jgi:hypothetical protein